MKRTKKKCDKCKKLISLSNYNRHINSCGNKSVIHIEDKWCVSVDKYKCPHCNKVYSKRGIATHIWRNHGDGKKHHEKINYENRVVWNKGLTKYTDDRVKKIGETYSEGCKNGTIIPSFSGKKHTSVTKLKISKKLSLNNHGDKCKWFEYEKKNGEVIKLQGTWEVRFAKVLDIIDENWIKIGANQNSIRHSFIWIDNENNKHHYSPDFYSPKLEKYFEVKGYWWGDDKLKMKLVFEQNKNINIEIVRKKQLQEYEKLIR